MACPNCGSGNYIKNGRGRVACKDCFKTFNDPNRGVTHFAAPDGHTVRGVSTLHDADGNVKAQWVKTDTSRLQQEKALQEIAEAAIAKLPRVSQKRAAVGKTLPFLSTGYPIGDAHIGMLSWPEETGEKWDLAEATRVQCAAVDYLTSAAPKTETATLVSLGDWFHYDNLEPVTTRSGHVLDADSRYAKMAASGLYIMRKCVETALRRHDQVKVICVTGNHDETSSLWLGMALHHLYENDPRVEVDQSPAPFRYFRFGKTLVGCYHGHQCKPDRLPGVMAADKAVDWGETEHRYWWLGHVHHQQIKEHPGCFVESFNTLAAKDAYATAGGWRAQRNMRAIVLHEEHGEVARHTVNARMLSDGHY